MTVQRYPLDRILPNPFQTRQAEDPADVARLAESIAQVGMLQIPVGRPRPGSLAVELAFGHTRLAAFKALAQEKHADPKTEIWDYDQMPVDVRELTDLEMFELAVRENLDRKDLTPIEEARAMATYRDQFSKTSAEIGVLFGLSDWAVRNKMRLLELPKGVQEKVQSRELNEGTARKLLVLQKMAPKAIPDVANVITGKTKAWQSVDETIEQALQEVSYTLQAGSRDWWPLDWRGTVEPPAPAALGKLLGKGAPKVEELLGITEAFRSGMDVAGVVKLYGIGEDIADRIWHFVAPPPCSICDFHQVFDGGHHCGIQACAEQKEQAWISHELARISKKLAVPIYDAAVDGKTKHEPPDYYSPKTYQQMLEPSWQKLLDAKDEGLRVETDSPGYREHPGTGSRFVRLILVGPGAEKKLAKQKSRTSPTDYGRRESERRKKAAISGRFLEHEAAPIFASMLKPIDNLSVLEALSNVAHGSWSKPKLPAKKAERVSRLRELIAAQVLEDLANFTIQARGPVATAKHLQGVAKALGVRLPADWLKRAEGYMPKAKTNGKSVSVETDDDEETS